MRRAIDWLRTVALVALLGSTAYSQSSGNFPFLLGNWSSPQILEHLSHVNAKLSPGAAGLLLVAPEGKTGSFFFDVPSNSQNWRPFAALGIEVENSGPQPVKVTLQAEKIVGARVIPAGQSARIVLPLSNPAFTYPGMMVQPPFDGWGKFQSVHGRSDLKQIQVVGIQCQSKAATQLQISKLMLLPGIKMAGMVDEFGQWNGRSWPGKVLAENDLRIIDPAPATPSTNDAFDEYGGWTKGPTTQASGYFRTEKIGNRWWLITPAGHPFFSTGVNSIGTAESTPITGRESFFATLPTKPPLLDHFSKDAAGASSFEFYSANLERKFGADWSSKWRDETLIRLKNWGFNTIGAWSDPQLLAGQKSAYTAIVHVKLETAKIPVDGSQKNFVPDPFDPAYAQALGAAMKKEAASSANDPWCIGYFVGNEFPWGGWSGPGRYAVVLGVMRLPGTIPAKQALCDRLAQKYADVKTLSDRWKMKIGSWDSLRHNPWNPPPKWTPELEKDLQDLSQTFADQYFHTVLEVVHQSAPHHLYLGCRFAGRTPEFVTAAAKNCDVTSINWYHPVVDSHDPTIQLLAKLDRPAIISEFHNGATDRGLFGTGLVWAADQPMRAQLYHDYVFSAGDSGFIVGCHWFQYADQPLTGRTGDGENYGIGLVTITDKPYTELTNAASTVNREIYPRRLNPPPAPKTEEEGNDKGQLAQAQ